MSVQWGGGDNLYVAQYDLSADANALGSVSGGNSPFEIPGITYSAQRRIGGRRDGRIEFSVWFNDATDAEHDALKALPTTDRVVSYLRGTTLGGPAASLVAKQIGYDWKRGDDGSLAGTVEALANAYGLQWGNTLTAGKRTDTTATNGTGVDFGTGSTAFGAQFFLHVFAFTGTSVTVTVQESSDNGAGDAFAAVTGGAFTAATGPTSQRIATSASQTVERYLRCVTTGTFSNAVFAVVAVRNDVSVVF